ncbi:MAG: RnfH family protein [Pseudomonadales bacterium]
MRVEVAYAAEQKQKIITLEVDEGTSAFDAAVLSKITHVFPEIDLDEIPMGIFGKAIRKPKDEVLREGDRVELYRPLIADPKVVRAKRAAKKAEEE